MIHYYDPQKGSISIGGQKLCDMSLEALNSRISYVAQDQYLFNTSMFIPSPVQNETDVMCHAFPGA